MFGIALLVGCGAEVESPRPVPIPPATVPFSGHVVVPYDRDGDGFGFTDCNDADALVHPGAPDGCDGVDSDCDGELELDSDADGFLACAECDDADAQRFPGASDDLDGIDQNCDRIDGPAIIADLAFTGSGPRTGQRIAAGDLDGDGDDELLVNAWDSAAILDFATGGISASIRPSTDEFATDASIVRGLSPRLATIDTWGGRLLLHDPVGASWPSAASGELVVPGSLIGVASAGAWVGVLAIDPADIEVLLVPADLREVTTEPTHVLTASELGYLGGIPELSLADAGDRDGDGVAELALNCCRSMPDTVRVVTPGVESHVDDAAEEWGNPPYGAWLSRQDGSDVDGDGRPDLALGSAGTLSVVPWVGPGRHVVEDQRLFHVPWVDHPAASALRDVDGDGVMDLVTVTVSHTVDWSPAAALYLGPLQGELTPEHAALRFVGPAAGWNDASVVLADLDGSGGLDLAVGAPLDGGVGAVYLVPDLATKL